MEKTLKSTLIHKGKNFNFLVDKVELDNKKQINREIVEHPGAVAILPLSRKDKIILINQYRYSTKSELLEIPAGTLEIGESPDECALRELKEETGYSTKLLKKMTTCYLAPGYSNEIIHIYVAKELIMENQAPEEDEKISIKEYEFDEALAMIEEGVIHDAKTILSILLYLTSTKF